MGTSRLFLGYWIIGICLELANRYWYQQECGYLNSSSFSANLQVLSYLIVNKFCQVINLYVQFTFGYSNFIFLSNLQAFIVQQCKKIYQQLKIDNIFITLQYSQQLCFNFAKIQFASFIEELALFKCRLCTLANQNFISENNFVSL